MWADADVGQGEIEGIRILAKVPRAWSTLKGNGPSPRVKCIRNEGFCEVEDRRGEWWTRLVSVALEMEYGPKRDVVDVVQIHPRTIRGRQRVFHLPTLPSKLSILSTLGMVAASLPRPVPIQNL